LILNCRNFNCKFNTKGKCCLESITLQDDGSPMISKLICIEAEEMSKEAKLLDSETAWGTPEEDMPQQEHKNYFDQFNEKVEDDIC